jgi:hypothetical protein
MNTLNDLIVTEPSAQEATTTSTARVTYHFTAGGQERTFTLDATVSGSAAEAALGLITAGWDDARHWLRAQIPTAPTAVVLSKGLFGQRRVKVKTERVEPATEPQHGCVAATVEIDGVIHEYTGEVSTVGNPYRATSAALTAAKEDLWSWAWDQKKVR